jgi:hypothetical protein
MALTINIAVMVLLHLPLCMPEKYVINSVLNCKVIVMVLTVCIEFLLYNLTSENMLKYNRWTVESCTCY